MKRQFKYHQKFSSRIPPTPTPPIKIAFEYLGADKIDLLSPEDLETIAHSVVGNVDWEQPQNFMGSGGNTVYNPSED